MEIKRLSFDVSADPAVPKYNAGFAGVSVHSGGVAYPSANQGYGLYAAMQSRAEESNPSGSDGIVCSAQ